MRCRRIRLSRPRRFIEHVTALASSVPTVPVQRRMKLLSVAQARIAAGRPCWPALFLKAYGLVAQRMPELRRAYLGLPWPHLIEYPLNVANVAIERDYEGEPAVFFARFGEPGNDSIAHLDELMHEYATRPINEIKRFRKQMRVAGLPRSLLRMGLRLAMNLPRMRPGLFGTFGLSVYSSLGSESLHPLSPLTTTLTYGVIDDRGEVNVRLIYDHRVLDGATVARALAALEGELKGRVLAELFAMAGRPSLRVAA